MFFAKAPPRGFQPSGGPVEARSPQGSRQVFAWEVRPWLVPPGLPAGSVWIRSRSYRNHVEVSVGVFHVSIVNGQCRLLLVQLGEGDAPPWTLELKKDSATRIGSGAEGVGRLESPGVEREHLLIRRDRYGTKILPLHGGAVFLNANPLTAQGETTLVKGDRVRLGSPRVGVDLIVICSSELSGLSLGPEGEEQDGNVSAFESVLAGRKSAKAAWGSGMLSLTPAEYEIVAWIGRGVHDLEEIAARLFRSVNTVRTQLNRIYDKLEVHSKAELCAFIIQNWLNYQHQSHPLQRVAGTCDCLAESGSLTV